MNRQKSEKQNIVTALLLVLLALVATTAATAAWFSIADTARVRSMGMEINAGPSVRFDLDPHPTFEQYVKSLRFEEIAARIRQEKGFDMTETPLDPVTTTDAQRFELKNGTVVESTEGKYLEFTLHFMATKDVLLHLTADSGKKEGDNGTRVASETARLPEAMRISFTVDGQTLVYDPGLGDTSQTYGSMRVFGLPPAGQMVYNGNNYLFPLQEATDKTVVMHIWMEGTDDACTNDLKGGDWQISLRFMATDENHVPVEGTE